MIGQNRPVFQSLRRLPAVGKVKQELKLTAPFEMPDKRLCQFFSAAFSSTALA